MNEGKKLYRSEDDRFISGVCGGLGEYFNADSTLVRIIFVIAILITGGAGFIAYLLMWLIMPLPPIEDDDDFDDEDVPLEEEDIDAKAWADAQKGEAEPEAPAPTEES